MMSQQIDPLIQDIFIDTWGTSSAKLAWEPPKSVVQGSWWSNKTSYDSYDSYDQESRFPDYKTLRKHTELWLFSYRTVSLRVLVRGIHTESETVNGLKHMCHMSEHPLKKNFRLKIRHMSEHPMSSCRHHHDPVTIIRIFILWFRQSSQRQPVWILSWHSMATWGNRNLFASNKNMFMIGFCNEQLTKASKSQQNQWES